MNKGKLIGILVASVGVVASFATAYSLYTRPVDSIDFGIGAQTHTGSTDAVNYQINDSAAPTVAPAYHKAATDNDPGFGVSEEYRRVRYEFALGATFGSTVTPQTYIMGNLSVSLTGIKEAIRNHVTATIKMEGYTEGTLGATHYGGYRKSGSDDINAMPLTADSLSVNADDIAVSASGKQKLVVEFLFDGITALQMNELSSLWSLSVTWAKPSEGFESAYFRNNQTEWSDDDEFVMAPNIGYTGSWEWTCQVKGSSSLQEGKPAIGSTWAGKWERGENDLVDNLILDNGKTYDVYWNGNDGSTFYASAQSNS